MTQMVVDSTQELLMGEMEDIPFVSEVGPCLRYFPQEVFIPQTTAFE
jgi:hypothetical protein